MSTILGMRRTDGEIVSEGDVLTLACATSCYSDTTFVRGQGGVGMVFQPYYTHSRSRLEREPLTDERGNMVTLDGRLDNHLELCEKLKLEKANTSDSRIVLAAFNRWGEDCFAKMIGDWAIALWVPGTLSLYLARDHAGTKTLYFEAEDDTLVWSTYLDTFFVGRSARSLDETYAAHYLACRPVGQLTPYRGIRSVAPAHYVVATRGSIEQKMHWNPVHRGTISYSTDEEYEEHFLTLFEKSVRRRSATGGSILVHLSGGMDSTSIVCMDDVISLRISPTATDLRLLNTLSYFDSSEPHWDEAPFVAAVEKHRKKSGLHLELSLSDRTFTMPPVEHARYLLPGLDTSSYAWEQKLCEALKSTDVRVFITGNGGDEVLGGVPTPLPELADELVALRLGVFFRQAVRWCLSNRSSLLGIIQRTISYLINLHWEREDGGTRTPPWIMRSSQTEYDLQVRSGFSSYLFHHPRPSQIENGDTWWKILEYLPHMQPGALRRYEYRYPYLDRDLVEFLFSIPREQLTRPGRRRSLMRRALREIVPQEVLERKRKAFCVRGPMLAVARCAEERQRNGDSLAVSLGIVDETAVKQAFAEVIAGKGNDHIGALMRVLSFDSWARHQAKAGLLALPVRTK